MARVDLPALPERIEPASLSRLSDEDLEATVHALQSAERATLEAMAPYDRQLREIRARGAEIATEQRRRERAEHVARRATVRELAKSGGMPGLGDALAAPDTPFALDAPLQALRAFLGTGGEIGFGFATRPGTIGFTDGRQQQQARTWGEARELHARGWDPGAPGVPGVRIHLAGSRVERVVGVDDVVLDTNAPA